MKLFWLMKISQKIRILMDSLKLFCYRCGMTTKKFRMVQLQLEDRAFTSGTHIMYAQCNPLSGFGNNILVFAGKVYCPHCKCECSQATALSPFPEPKCFYLNFVFLFAYLHIYMFLFCILYFVSATRPLLSPRSPNPSVFI